LIAFLGVNLANDQFLAHRASAIARPVHQARGRMAADLMSPIQQRLGQTRWREVGPVETAALGLTAYLGR
jgi:hypothetical protein